MSAALRAADRRAVAVLGCGLLGAAGLGLIAGRWPLVALAAAAALVVAVVMLKDLTIGIAVFTVVSFAGVLSSGSASVAKGVGVLLVLAWVGALVRRSGRDVPSLLAEHRPLVVCAAGLVAWSALSAAWAHSAGAALSGASSWAQDLLLLPIVYTGLTRLRHVRWLMIAFVAGALLAILYGALSGSTVAGSRLASALDDPNYTAAVLVAAAVLAVALGAGATRASHRWIAFAAALAALLGLVATASRGGLVALAIAALAAVVLGGRWRARITAAAAVGAVLVLGWFLLLAPPSSLSHVSTLQTERTTLWTVAGRAIEANPVVGVGNDNFAQVAKFYLIQPGVTTSAGQIVTVPHVAHNAYLEILADLGIVGLMLFVGLVLYSLRAALRAIKRLELDGRRADEILARGLVVAIAAVLGAELFISDLYSKQLFLLLAVAPVMLRLARLPRAVR